MANIVRETLLQEVLKQHHENQDSRILIGLAGAPGSGKSTLAKWLMDNLNDGTDELIAAILPQDGFHYDDRVLEQRNRLKYKGAPDTFDTNGLLSMLKRVALEPEIAIPVFDRELEISRNCAEVIRSATRILIVEGNYLLLNEPDSWSRLRQHFSLTVFLQLPIQELERRLISRWLKHGYNQDEAKAKTLENDIPNAVFVTQNSAAADWVISEE